MQTVEDRVRAEFSIARGDLAKTILELRALKRKRRGLKERLALLERLLADNENSAQLSSDITAGDKAEQILRTKSHQMRLVDIVEQAISDGYGGSNVDRSRLMALFSSALIRGTTGPNPRFVKIDRGLFRLGEDKNDQIAGVVGGREIESNTRDIAIRRQA